MKTKNKETKLILYFKGKSQELIKDYLNKKCDLKELERRLEKLESEAEAELLELGHLGLTPLALKIDSHLENVKIIINKNEAKEA